MDTGLPFLNVSNAAIDSPIPNNNNSDDSPLPTTNGLGRKVRNIDIPLAARRVIQPSIATIGSLNDSSQKLDQQPDSAVLGSEFLTQNVPRSDAIGNDGPIRVVDVNIPTGLINPVDIAADSSKGSNSPKVSYAETLKDNIQVGTVNFRVLHSESMDGADIVLPREAVKVVYDRLQHTLYGYFLGKRLAFPVVEYFVKQRWVKFGLQKIMMNTNGFFFFKFSDAKGMNEVLKQGPWLIRNVPLFLNIWNPSETLRKDEVKKVTVWVKIHNVPLTAYTDDGLSMIATKIGIPKGMDILTAKMCKDSWGKSSYARTMIEISADKEIKEEISIAIPNLEDDGYHKESMRVEYEWKPMRCGECCVFGHSGNNCSKRPKDVPKVVPVTDNDGFQEVKVKRKIPLVVKPAKPKFVYKPVVKKPDVSKVDPSKVTSYPASFDDYKKVQDQEPKVVYKPFNYKKMVGGAATSSAKGKEQVFSNNSFEALNGLAYEDSSDFEPDEEYDDYTRPDYSHG